VRIAAVAVRKLVNETGLIVC